MTRPEVTRAMGCARESVGCADLATMQKEVARDPSGWTAALRTKMLRFVVASSPFALRKKTSCSR